MVTDFRNVLTSLKIAAMDAAWVEEKHHRSDNGRFTSGSGRGKTGGSEEKGGGRGGKGGGERGKKEEIEQDAAEKIVRAAFEKCGGKIEKMDLVGHHLSVKTNFTDIKALNKELGERGLKAKQENERTLHIAEDAAEDYENDPFFKLLVALMQIGFCAKDLHYGATGKSFYGIHELADIAWKFTRMFDDINEIRYMGELGTIPPSRQLVAFEAAKGMEQSNDGETGALTTRQLIERVLGAVENAEEAVVAAKAVGCAAGTQAILDEVSKDCLKVSGLLFQSLKNDDPPQPVNADAIDRVIQKGIFIKPGATGQDAGTSEGAKKGWEKRKSGNFSIGANDLLKNVKFEKRNGSTTFFPNNGRLVKIYGEEDPCIVSGQAAPKYGMRRFDVISSDGKTKTVSESSISHMEDTDMFPERDIKRSIRLLRRIGAEIPESLSHYSYPHVTADPVDGKMKHFPSEREVHQKDGGTTWFFTDDNTPVFKD